MTAIESAYVDARAFNAITLPGDLTAIEPAITFVVGADEAVSANPANASPVGTVYVFSANAATYGMGTNAANDVSFGVRVNKSGAAIAGINSGATYYKDGVVTTW